MILGIFLPDFRFKVQEQIGKSRTHNQKNWLESNRVFCCSFGMYKTFLGSGYLDNYHIVVAWSTFSSQIFSIFSFPSSNVVCFPKIRNFYSRFFNLAKGPHRNFSKCQMDVVWQ